MMTCVYEPCTADFNSLPHIDDVSEEDLTAKAAAALELFTAWGLERVLSAERNHNHYQLARDEVVVMSVVRHGTEMRIDPLPYDKDAMFPVAFVITSDGRLIATCWMQRGPETAAVEARLAALEAVPEATLASFLGAFHDVCGDAMGLGIRFDDLFQLDDEEGAHVMERTYADRSQSLTVAKGTRSATTVQTSWATGAEDGSGRPWTRNCNRYCEWGPFKGHVTVHQR